MPDKPALYPAQATSWDEDCDLIQVVLTPAEAARLKASLALRGLELHAIPPGAWPLPAYGVRGQDPVPGEGAP